MNINRTEAFAAISQNPGTKKEKNSNTVFADLLRAQQQAQPATEPVRAVTATSPVAAAAQKPATSASVAEPEASSEKSAVQEFRDYMAMSDAEKMRAAVLKEMGLTEEEFEQLPPEEQLAIEQKIIERLKQETGVSDTGFNTKAISLLLQEVPQPG
ncbi:hypothetical protein [Thalassolituus hydrocarboniclasticus]|uniref:Uncharacterized protein n=1 Tax=Thalassolituus hydrocarboniclasticus TaxID=2742796 RepID=A0ABY6A6L0_9GAMM|nr:hypothetical protein [Thalassolituus hydrocarboniclasticus]UXD85994.1 hypothetical protein HUF19_00360 [Thalassolituus hydrocarboniclasticus]